RTGGGRATPIWGERCMTISGCPVTAATWSLPAASPSTYGGFPRTTSSASAMRCSMASRPPCRLGAARSATTTSSCCGLTCAAGAEHRRECRGKSDCGKIATGADMWCLLSRRAFATPCGDRLVGRGHTSEIGAVRRGIIAARTRLAGEEHAIVHRRGKDGSAVRLARQGIGVGAARERIDTPAMEMKRLHALSEVAAQQAHQFADGEVSECRLAARLELCRQASPKIRLDLRPAEGSEMIDACVGAVGAAKEAALFVEFLSRRQRQKQFVGKPQGQARSRLRFFGQGRGEEKLPFGEQAARDRDDDAISPYCTTCCVHSQSPPAAIDQSHRLAEHGRQARTMGGDRRPVALDDSPVDAAVVVATDIPRRDPIELRSVRVRADGVDQGIPLAERLEKCRGRNVRRLLGVGMKLLVEFLLRLQKAGLLRERKTDRSGTP